MAKRNIRDRRGGDSESRPLSRFLETLESYMERAKVKGDIDKLLEDK